jgi:hypothetical protein
VTGTQLFSKQVRKIIRNRYLQNSGLTNNCALPDETGYLNIVAHRKPAALIKGL